MMIRDLGEVIGQHRLFAGLDPAFLDLVAGCSANRVFRPGTVLAREGASFDHLYLLRAGHVGLDVVAPGRGRLRIQTVGPDDVLGLSWLVPPYVWRYDATALEEVRAVEIDATCLRAKCEADPAVGYAVLKRFMQPIVERLQGTRLQLLDVYGTPR
ncbi:cyclic nucleotide-binding domain-containing protein [Roseibacterium sp. SDUM158016]|uniref:cyclic nucleotide-binding domain-containing protein n=1 Tax=Roseicyclus sediminis TaxID=2980997 RepID=UPI0021D09B34|nr:cyclic nucleotide-binding domain-containing protein [Roseibacterium sp. SDUM158016]MCU4653946.1 cyclic nucleotide-binding domain-containing protein [Roseibacterium sp. SDUM158016]